VNTRQTLLLASYSCRTSVRGGIGLVFLLLSLTFGLVVAGLMLRPVESYARYRDRSGADRPEITAEVLSDLTEHARPAVAWAVSSRSKGVDPVHDRRAEEWADYLLQDRPGILSAIYLILLFGWPLIVSFGAFDLYAGDIGSRQLRYQLLRADRSSIFFGRLLGSVLTFVVVLLVLGIAITLYIQFKLPVYGWWRLLGWSTYCTLALLWLSLPYIALCAWISAACGSSFLSLTLVSLVIGGVPLFAMVAGAMHEAGGYVTYLLPWGFQTRLLHHDPWQAALAAVACLLQAALFTWLAHRTFTTRDL
jgi:hypothetical protein